MATNNLVLPGKARESGAALVLSLLMLLIFTMLALTSMQNSIMQQKMVSGMSSRISSLEIAESGLYDAEQLLEDISTILAFDGADGLFGMNDTAPSPLTLDWANSTNLRDGNTIAGITPRYFIQHMGNADPVNPVSDIVVEGYTHETNAENAQAFRIVVWVAGDLGQSMRIIESYYVRDI